jgi:hypothetical protein
VKPRKLVKASARGTFSLGSLADETYYFAEVDDEGRIILTPAVILPVDQIRGFDDQQG